MIEENSTGYIVETVMKGLKGLTVIESLGILETIKYQLLQKALNNDPSNTTWQNLKE